MENISGLDLPEGVDIQWIKPVEEEPPYAMLFVAMLLLAVLMVGVTACLFGPPLPPRSGLLRGVRGRVLLVVAHPDDEAMFFWPTLLRLHGAGVPLGVLCLSTGGADGLGDVRVEEMRKSCARVGVTGADLVILDAKDLQDGFHAWPEEVVASHVLEVARTQRADLLLTFDDAGVSGHPNHVSTSRGVRLAQRMSRGAPAGDGGGTKTGLRVLLLETVGLPRKYVGPLNLLLFHASLDSDAPSRQPPACTCRSPTACLAALSAHWSQLVWYRVLFTVFSRYAYLNTYAEQAPAAHDGAGSSCGSVRGSEAAGVEGPGKKGAASTAAQQRRRTAGPDSHARDEAD